MTPEALLALVEEATPGPWFVTIDSLDTTTSVISTAPATIITADEDVIAEVFGADARLIALAPALARLCVEQQEALEAIEVSEPDWAQGVDENCETLRTIARAALARFAALESP